MGTFGSFWNLVIFWIHLEVLKFNFIVHFPFHIHDWVFWEEPKIKISNCYSQIEYSVKYLYYLPLLVVTVMNTHALPSPYNSFNVLHNLCIIACHFWQWTMSNVCLHTSHCLQHAAPWHCRLLCPHIHTLYPACCMDTHPVTLQKLIYLISFQYLAGCTRS